MRFPPRALSYFMVLFVVFAAGHCYAQAVGDYQTVGSGNWNTVAVWNTWNGTAWVAPVGTPNNTNGLITINAGHTITIPAALTIDQCVINGTVNCGTAITLTIANGAGVDLTINGTYGDFATPSIVWNAGATWEMGATGTLIKTTGSSSNNWQLNYQGGIGNIPATSNWILRKVGTAQPALSTTSPATGSVYPNLTIENNAAAAWTTPLGSSFTGNTAFPTIKGNLNIGGSGSNTVDFLTSNTNANPMVVMGDLFIRAGCGFRINGTGVEVRGNITVNGNTTYDANDGRRIVFGGGNNQAVSGTGTFNVYDMTFNKSGGTVTLNRTVTVDNLCTFTSGIVNTTATNLLIIAAAGSVSGANNASFVDGPVRYLGTGAFIFPTGETADYQPIAISGYSTVTLFTENFNNGCTSLCDASTYPGWAVTSTGINDASANLFYVSCAENGNAVGACGTGCGSDATLHVGNVSTSPAAFFFCPTGDCGAAYDAGLGGNQTRTSKRAESPVINCTGYSNIVFSFKYMEGGSGTNDNALAWYFDGTTWTMIADMPKTVVCAGQGTWTAYSVTLPASANNNPNVRVGFQWVNNDDGAGADPSFAVDNVTVGINEYFTAEYNHSDPQVPYGSTMAPTLMYLSNCEYWMLDRAPGANTQTSVTLAFDANSCPVWALSDLRVARYDGVSTWQDEGNTATTGTTGAGTVTGNVVTSFSPFTLAAITSNPLPVVLTVFDAWYADGAAELAWSTSSEIDNHYFTIERAGADGVYIPIGRVDGHGTTSQPNQYRFTDTDPYTGVNYYRLKQVDYNGQFEYSPVRLVNTEEEVQFDVISVGAVNAHIDLSVAAADGSTLYAQVTDVSGRVVYSSVTVVQQQPTHFVTLQLTPGIYFVEVTDGKERIVRKVQVLNE